MADIKVQRKSGLPWWVWLVLALIAFALLWWAFTAFGGDDEGPDVSAGPAVLTPEGATGAAPGATAATPGGEAAAGEPITSLDVLLGAGDGAALAGRPVQLDDVPVQAMVGDATFWVGSAGQRIFVVLDEQIPSPPPLVEGRVNVNIGQSVDIRGRVRRADDRPAGDVLSDNDRRALGGQRVYIWAEAVEVATPTSAAPAGPPGRTSR